MNYYANVDGREIAITLSRREGRLEVESADFGSHPASVVPHPDSGHYGVWLGGSLLEVTLLERSGSKLEIVLGGKRFQVDVQGEIDRILGVGDSDSGAESWNVRSVMPGIVTKLSVAEGDPVDVGQPLLYLEAMKMENEVRTEHAGRIQTLHVSCGDTVEGGALLVTVVPLETSEK